ncbi:7787_t:CDS:10 [Ambispora gerdemannii]|uniref:7787_t:CDS:1 n=1 Tax=Ambispora gerdemannii TaxID=144530 RepID=A0A9N8YM00_9GLOM|nr:7787_t:CDS:10 [Ambispora gerdemannii]
MPNPIKASQREKELDAARCKGNWVAIPELARKYRKHNPDGIVLEQTALAEFSLVLAIEQIERQDDMGPLIYDDDKPDHISIGPVVDASMVNDVFEKLEIATVKSEGEEKQYTNIILGRAYFSTGAYAKCLETLQAPFVPTKLPAGYNFVLIIQGITIRGMALEVTEDFKGAIECYDKVTGLLTQRSADRSAQLMDTSGALHAFRTYQEYSGFWDKFRLNKRAVIYRNFIELLSKTYQEGTYVPPSAPEILSSNGQYTPNTFRAELTRLHGLYESVLYQITSFPKAGEVNWRILDMVDQVMADWALLGCRKPSEMRGLVEMLYRATEMTFHSPRILRHLINSLMIFGEYEEAELALNAYIALVEKAKETQKDDVERKSQESAGSIESKRAQVSENELLPEVVQTLLTGVIVTGKYLNNATLELAEKARALCEDDESESIDDELFAQSWRCLGVAYSLLAFEASDPEVRPDLHEKAISALNKSISLDSECVESYYQLALEYAVIRKTSQAIENTRQALVLDNSNIPSWHLLALLFSSQKDIQGALKACEVATKESDWETTDSSVDYGALTAIGTEDGEEFFAFKMTQRALLELMHGPEAVILHHQGLFKLYGKIFPENTFSPTGSIYESASLRKRDNEDALSAQATRSLSAENSRSFSNLRTKDNNSPEGSIHSVGIKDMLDVPKANYAVSVASSKNSNSSAIRRSPTPTISGIASMKSIPASTAHSSQPPSIRQRRANKALSELWLASAAAYRRLGNFEEVQKAIESAEEIDGTNPDLWCQLGLFHFAQSQYSTAITLFQKALSLDAFHVPSLVHLGRTYLLTGEIELAEGLLESATKGRGWDCAEAWQVFPRLEACAAVQCVTAVSSIERSISKKVSHLMNFSVRDYINSFGM